MFTLLISFIANEIHGETATSKIMKETVMMKMVMMIMMMMRMVMMVMIRLIERRGRSAPQEAAPFLLPTVNNQPQENIKSKFLSGFHLSSSSCLQH